MRLLAFLVAVALSAGLGSSAAAQRSQGGGGIGITVPTGWHVLNPPSGLGSTVTEPVTRLVAASAPFRFARTACQVASYSFPADAVAIVVLEWTKPTPGVTWQPRPARFSAASLPLRPPPAIECYRGRGGSVQFADHGRHFGVYLLAGLHATGALIQQARAVLDTLTVKPR